MQKILLIITLCFTGFFLSCSSPATATSVLTNPVQNDLRETDACQEWQALYDELSDREKNELIIHGKATSSEGFLISSQLVPDCRLRLQIGSFIKNMLSGIDNPADKEFAGQNSREIVRVAKATWDYYYDGAHHEKYALLMNEGLKDEEVAPFVGELIKAKGFNPRDKEPELFGVLFDRPLPSLTQIVQEELKKSEGKKDYLGQFYALIILQRDLRETKYILKLKKISQNKNLSAKARNILSGIVDKLERDEKLDYEEADNFIFAMIE